MAPPGKTSLVAEIPCGADEGEKGAWEMDDKTLIAEVTAQMVETRLLDPRRVLYGEVYRMRDAYPVLERGYEQKVAALTSWLGRFANLHLSGRNGTFSYIHIHDLLALSRKLAARLAGT
jgi:protoporphyrinogen oxidase